MTRRRHTTSIRKVRLFVTVPQHIDGGLREYAASRRMDLSDVVTRALTAYLSPGAQDQREAIIANRLTSLQSQVEQSRTEIELLTELVAILTKLNLAVTPEPISSEERSQWNTKVARRWQTVITRIVDQTNAGKTLFEDLRKRVELTPADFTAADPEPTEASE
ncbi:MAG: hypothetical protein M0T84_08750 [Betaproteobacteria bacterium]|nr:hypothetical protein [Betaproteobacteria bacterium]